MAGLFDRPPQRPPQGLFGGIFAGMGRGLTNPGGFFVNEGAPAAQALGSMVLSPFVQANQAMPWGGNDPSAIGIDPQTGSIDPNVMVPWATDVAGTATTGSLMAPPVAGLGMGIRAYHGSPHDFERFDISKIGTGEGAQAYGHGLYFAENPAVAADYKRTLSAGRWRDVQDRIDIDPETEMYRGTRPDGSVQTFANEKDAQEWVSEGMGRQYEVDIDASPDEFLDWDKPLSEQPENIRRALGWTPEAEAAFKKAQASDTDSLAAALQGDATYSGSKMPVLQGVPSLNAAGADIVNRYPDKLRDAGIKGIRYKDAGSRKLPSTPATDMAQSYLREAGGDIDKALAAYDEHIATVPARLRDASMDEIRDAISMGGRPVEQTHNYVVFDDKIISILKKYGLAGLTAGGAGAAMLGGGTDQAQAAQPPWMTGGRF